MSPLGFDPLSVLGCDEDEFHTLMHGLPVTPGEVEAAASHHYRWREHVHDADSYWVTAAEAARLLGTSPAAVRRLLATGRLPYLTHVSGVRLMVRREVEQLAGASTTPRARPARRRGTVRRRPGS